ncbi:MAG: hypothetical protein NZT92_11335 [Abditibacteriales bacterium]|nr:hypothetical protein [Abditibacteriales bacterium]
MPLPPSPLPPVLPLGMPNGLAIIAGFDALPPPPDRFAAGGVEWLGGAGGSGLPCGADGASFGLSGTSALLTMGRADSGCLAVLLRCLGCGAGRATFFLTGKTGGMTGDRATTTRFGSCGRSTRVGVIVTGDTTSTSISTRDFSCPPA